MVQDQIQEILDELKMTPEDFGKAIGVGKSSVYKLLRGDTKKITKNFARKINAVFSKYSVEYLLSLNYQSRSVNADDEEKLTDEEIKVVSRVILLKEKQILEVPFFKKWLKEKKLAAKVEVYEQVDELKEEELKRLLDENN